MFKSVSDPTGILVTSKDDKPGDAVKNMTDHGESPQTCVKQARESVEDVGANLSDIRARYPIGPMQVTVEYAATIGRVEFHKRGEEEYIFVQTKHALT